MAKIRKEKAEAPAKASPIKGTGELKPILRGSVIVGWKRE